MSESDPAAASQQVQHQVHRPLRFHAEQCHIMVGLLHSLGTITFTTLSQTGSTLCSPKKDCSVKFPWHRGRAAVKISVSSALVDPCKVGLVGQSWHHFTLRPPIPTGSFWLHPDVSGFPLDQVLPCSCSTEVHSLAADTSLFMLCS